MNENSFFNQWENITNTSLNIPINGIGTSIESDLILKEKLTETPFFLIDANTKLLIPERMYKKYKYKNTYSIIINDTKELLKDNKENSDNSLKIKVIFLTTDGNKINISKYEYYFETQLTKMEGTLHTDYYKFSPYYSFNLSDNFLNFYDLFDKNLNSNFQLYMERRLLFPEINYKIDIENNKIYIFNTSNLSIKLDNTTSYKFDILAFHSGDINRIEHLSQSGLIYLDTNKIDRNYNNDLMAIFLNGKLINKSSDYIKQISNSIYKMISSKIKTRYDLNILNISPKIDQLLPFYKKFTYDLSTLLNKSNINANNKITINSKIYNK